MYHVNITVIVWFQGFYGEVYLCKLLQRGGRSIPCAVKKMIHRERDDEAAQRSLIEFENELKMMVPLNHQNIVRVYGECFYTFAGELST